MIKRFFNQASACEYIIAEGLPIDSLREGNNGMNYVEINGIGGQTSAKSSDLIKKNKSGRLSC